MPGGVGDVRCTSSQRRETACMLVALVQESVYALCNRTTSIEEDVISQLLTENESTYTCPEAQELPADTSSSAPASASASVSVVGSSSQAPQSTQAQQTFACVSTPAATLSCTNGCSLEAVHFPTLDLTRLQTSQAPPAAAATGLIAEPEASAPRAKTKPPYAKVC